MFKLLETINSPEDLRKLERDQLPQLAAELREFLIEQLREPLEWANTKRGIDASQLSPDGILRAGRDLKPGERLPLGNLLDSYHLGSIDMLRKFLNDLEQKVPKSRFNSG